LANHHIASAAAKQASRYELELTNHFEIASVAPTPRATTFNNYERVGWQAAE
jgi:hypothetical protein